MRKLIPAVLLLCCASLARGQSCTGYSANITPGALAPSDVAARGDVTATITVQADLKDANGNQLGFPSHSGSFTAGGTKLSFTYASNNGVSAQLQLYDNGNQVSNQSWPLNASTPDVWVTNANETGHYYVAVFTVLGTNGRTTQDRISFSIVAGSTPGIVSQDELPTNAYIQVAINFGGGSMLNNCSTCQTGNSQQCINATHTPYVTMTAVNHTSGESQSLPRQQAGNIAKSNESVSGNGSIWISALPGDTVDGTANGEIFCTMFGDLPVSGNDEWGLEWELAWTKFSTIQSTCLPTGDSTGSIGCKVTWQYMCSTNSKPPDLQPTIVFAQFDTNGNPVTLETVPPFWWGWGFGIRGHISAFTTPWIFPANVLQQYTRGHYLLLDISAGAFPSNSTIRNCTNKDKGTKPEIFPPLDQPL